MQFSNSWLFRQFQLERNWLSWRIMSRRRWHLREDSGTQRRWEKAMSMIHSWPSTENVFLASEIITRDCLSALVPYRTDIPADKYEGCRQGTYDPKLANYVNNSIKEINVKRDYFPSTTICFCFLDHRCNSSSTISSSMVLIFAAPLLALIKFLARNWGVILDTRQVFGVEKWELTATSSVFVKKNEMTRQLRKWWVHRQPHGLSICLWTSKKVSNCFMKSLRNLISNGNFSDCILDIGK